MSDAGHELTWQQTFKVTVIFRETEAQHQKNDDQSIVIFEAFNPMDCLCACEKLEDVQLVAAKGTRP